MKSSVENISPLISPREIFKTKKNYLCYYLDKDECSSDEHSCDRESEKCRNMPGSFTCDCQKGFKRDGDKCVKKKGKKKTDKGKKTVEEELADVLKKDDYFSEMQMKFGSVLFALFFACAVAAVMKRSLLAIVVMTVVYAFIWWYFRT